MSQRAKMWPVVAAAAVTLLTGAIFGITTGMVTSAMCWFAWSSLHVTASWLFERHRKTRDRSIRRLAVATALVAPLGLAGALFGVRYLFPDSPVGGVFGGILVGAAWSTAALITCRSFIKGPDAPPPLRWRDLTAPRPQP